MNSDAGSSIVHGVLFCCCVTDSRLVSSALSKPLNQSSKWDWIKSNHCSITIDTIYGIICTIHSTHQQTKLWTQHCSTLWRKQRLFCSGWPSLADLDPDFFPDFLHFSSISSIFTVRLFKPVRQSARIVQPQNNRDTWTHRFLLRWHFRSYGDSLQPSSSAPPPPPRRKPFRGGKSRRARCSLFPAHVLQMRERLECRLPWVTKEEETAMACKPSCNLVLLRVHRVPSNQMQPLMLDSQQWQSVFIAGAPGQLLRPRPGTITKNHNGRVGVGVTSHRTDHTGSI